jgi:ABC-2 type transport system ATP-binding protein
MESVLIIRPDMPLRNITAQRGVYVGMLEARGLVKCYVSIPAVNQVSFTVRPYQVLGYLGPNGSGKSTTVAMITGLIEPTRGEVFFDGVNIKRDLPAYKRRFGYVPEAAHLYPYLSGLEYLDMIARLRGLNAAGSARKIDDFLQLFGMHPDRYAPISAYSKGMRQKILITAALLHNPDLLIFDEPLSGLDVTTALIFRHLVKGLAAAGKMILYSSHVLEVVEKICSEVMILRRGEVVAHDSVERLRDQLHLGSLEDVFSQLASEENTEQTARDLVDVVHMPA